MPSFECRLWRAFRAFNEARLEAEATAAKRERWQRERRAILHRLAESDADTLDGAEWTTLDGRARQLERGIDLQGSRWTDAKTNAKQAHERWGKAWQDYSHAVHELQRMVASTIQLNRGDPDPHRELRRDLEQRRRGFESVQR